MAVKANARAGVKRYLAENGGVSQSPVSALSRALRSDSSVIAKTIDSLERAGEIDVVRHKSGRITSVRPKTHVSFDRTESSPDAKRNRMYAGDVPATLRDDQCSEVITIQTRPNEEPIVSNEVRAPHVSLSALKGLSLLEQLNLVFIHLRMLADEQGSLPVGGVAEMLTAEFDVSQARAATLNTQLGKLGLRTTIRLGAKFEGRQRLRGPNCVSAVNLDCEEVTQAMLDALDASASSPDQVLTPTCTPMPMAAVVPDVAPVVSAVEIDDVSLQLAGIIQQLEAELIASKTENGRLLQRVQTLTDENATLTTKLSERGVLAPTVLAVLSRYQKK